MRKILKLNIGILVSVLLVVVFAGYYYIPGVLGDTVYPLKYQDEIVKWSREHKLDPALTAAVIMQESRFSSSATSYKGARGLMQIMPETAKTIAKGVGESDYSLYDPETSIQFGTWHLHVMLEKYNNNVDAALAAYNAGGGNADIWLRMGIFENIDSIPFRETRHYVKNVKNYRQIYTSMYEEELGLTEPVDMNSQVQKKDLKTGFWSMLFERYLGGFVRKQSN